MPRTVILQYVRAGDRDPRKGREGAELWRCTRSALQYGHANDWDRWFDLHSRQARGEWKGIDPAVIDWYRQEPAGARPIYMAFDGSDLSDIPAAVPYPIEAITSAFGFTFGCTVDYMIALAVAEGFELIVLDGIGTKDDPAFQFNHRTILYWIGYARASGIDVEVIEPSCYGDQPLYGYEWFAHAELRAFLASYGPATATPDAMARPFSALVQQWRTVARTSPQCADELEHLIAVLQRERGIL